MTGAPRPHMKLILKRASAEARAARGDLFTQVYAKLRRVALGLMGREDPRHTLSPSAVVQHAFDRLGGLHEPRTQIVTLRYAGGMTAPQIAETQEASMSTFVRDWPIARVRLSDQLGREGVG